MGIECLVLGNSCNPALLRSLFLCVFLFSLVQCGSAYFTGAGQEVGKSCVVVSMGGKRIMFDCGMHMGYLDNRRFPDFSLISKTGDFDSALTCVVITHL
ncbi:hypothetical protein BHM03_00013077 [Ensete ventricosum]|nr:hypothetical protein BHM03_00013077 [Ensete ventricosum]